GQAGGRVVGSVVTGLDVGGTRMSYEVTRTDQAWRELLTPEEYHVLREQGTERPWTGDLLGETREGIYSCRACGAELFRAETKFEAHCGWPSFYQPKAEDAVELLEDRSEERRVGKECRARRAAYPQKRR